MYAAARAMAGIPALVDPVMHPYRHQGLFPMSAGASNSPAILFEYARNTVALALGCAPSELELCTHAAVLAVARRAAPKYEGPPCIRLAWDEAASGGSASAGAALAPSLTAGAALLSSVADVVRGTYGAVASAIAVTPTPASRHRVAMVLKKRCLAPPTMPRGPTYWAIYIPQDTRARPIVPAVSEVRLGTWAEIGSLVTGKRGALYFKHADETVAAAALTGFMGAAIIPAVMASPSWAPPPPTSGARRAGGAPPSPTAAPIDQLPQSPAVSCAGEVRGEGVRTARGCPPHLVAQLRAKISLIKDGMRHVDRSTAARKARVADGKAAGALAPDLRVTAAARAEAAAIGHDLADDEAIALRVLEAASNLTAVLGQDMLAAAAELVGGRARKLRTGELLHLGAPAPAAGGLPRGLGLTGLSGLTALEWSAEMAARLAKEGALIDAVHRCGLTRTSSPNCCLVCIAPGGYHAKLSQQRARPPPSSLGHATGEW